MTTTKFGLAQPVRRVEDPRLLKGAGRYTDDIVLPGMLFGVVLRSPHAAATITRLDTTAAAGLPGVAGVYTASDLSAEGIGPLPCAALVENRDGSPKPRRHIPCWLTAPYAMSATPSPSSSLTPLSTLGTRPRRSRSTTIFSPASPTCPLRWTKAAFWSGRMCRTTSLSTGKSVTKPPPKRNSRKAAHITKLTIVNNRIVVNSMEARVALADFDAETGRWTLYANTQGGWLVKNLIGPVFGADPEKFRVVTPDVGGGFGMKLFLYAEHVLTCYAARKLGRPVKWAADRGEAFLCDTQGRDNLTLGELAIDADGKFIALRTRNISNMGAYLSTFAPFIPTFAGTGVLASVYGFKAIYANVLGVFTNTVPVDAYRGAGRPESNYLVERLVDAAARELGIDKVELRRRNMVLARGDAALHAGREKLRQR